MKRLGTKQLIMGLLAAVGLSATGCASEPDLSHVDPTKAALYDDDTGELVYEGDYWVLADDELADPLQLCADDEPLAVTDGIVDLSIYTEVSCAGKPAESLSANYGPHTAKAVADGSVALYYTVGASRDGRVWVPVRSWDAYHGVAASAAEYQGTATADQLTLQPFQLELFLPENSTNNFTFEPGSLDRACPEFAFQGVVEEYRLDDGTLARDCALSGILVLSRMPAERGTGPLLIDAPDDGD